MVALLIIYLIVAWTRRIHLFAREVNPYELIFADVSGLLEGDPVLIRGYQAGQVTSIQPETNFVKVAITVNQDIPLYQDAKAEIQIKEIMGGKQITIFPGGGGEMLIPGSQIEGRAALDLSSSFSQVGRILDDVNEQKIDVLWQRFDRISRQMEAIMVNIDPNAPARILSNLEQSSNRIDALTEPVSPERIDQTWGQVEAMLIRADEALTRLNYVSDSLGALFGPRTDTLLTNLNHTLERVDALSNQAALIMARIQDEKTLAGRLLTDPSLTQQLDSTLFHLNETLKQVHQDKIIVGFRKPKEPDSKE
ncbi:MAG: MlaD family protein [Bacteroidota bacterium]